MAKKRFLDRIKDDLATEGLTARSRQARDWLRKKVIDVRWNSSAREAFINSGKLSRSVGGFNDITIGKMYFYFYDPKTKDRMKYYDTLPLVIPIDYKPASHSESGNDAGFLGLNLHYLSPTMRVILLDKLYTITTDSRFDENTKTKMRYSVMVGNKSFFKEAYPCLKWYLFKQFKSKALEISMDEWEIATFLPFEQFKKQSKQTVWKDSIRNISHRRG